jgi:hypothetical protein
VCYVSRMSKPKALKAEVIAFPVVPDSYAVRWIALSRDHHLVMYGAENHVVEIVRGEVKRRTKGIYTSNAFSIDDGKVVLEGMGNIGLWDDHDFVAHAIAVEAEVSPRTVFCDATRALVISNSPNRALAMCVGMDGKVHTRREEPGQFVYADQQYAYFVKIEECVAEVTRWDGTSSTSLGRLVRDVPFQIGAFGPSVKARSGRLLLQDNDMRVCVFGDGAPRQLDVRTANPVLLENGFLGTAGSSACRWNLRGEKVWGYPLSGYASRTLSADNLFAIHEKNRLFLLHAETGAAIFDDTLKLTATESIDGIVNTADGAIVINRRHPNGTKYAHWVAASREPVTLKHENIRGAMPYGDRMATWSDVGGGSIELYVWDIPSPQIST